MVTDTSLRLQTQVTFVYLLNALDVSSRAGVFLGMDAGTRLRRLPTSDEIGDSNQARWTQ
jgi:hypothetical protein